MHSTAEAAFNSFDAIEEFVEHYYKKTHYEALAQRVHDICKASLPEDLQALVTWRCKKRKSLRKKLRNMNAYRVREGRPPFQDPKEIEKSIFDLAAVRIALYVPQQKKEVIKAIDKWFPSVEWKGKRGKANHAYLCKRCGDQLEETECTMCRTKPDRHALDTVDEIALSGTDEIYNPVFAGYVADHARVRLSCEQARQPNRLSDWKEDHVVEIQVVSVLLHAWAQVEHDIIYKSIKAKAGVEERQILDSLNGFIISSELLLDQLYTRHKNRVESLKKEFSNRVALATFLDGYIGGVLSAEEKNTLELKMCHGLLKAVQKDSQQELHPILEELGFEEDNPITDLGMLGTRYSKLVEMASPFHLAKHMRLPFYIMEGVLSQVSVEAERAAQERAGDGAEPNSDEDRLYRCRVLLSSFVWIGRLSIEGYPSVVMETVRPANEEEWRAFEWPFNAPSRFNILVNGKTASEQDAKDMDILWGWFEKQKKDSFFSFVFRISRMGVIGSFPDDLALLRKRV
ncbi:hypothetical protein CC80DRAFT_492391 [Byssothecium circinans]|uniref:RelA/SpoT domain-containing protein n=1 Tax=Byssothecium circinans TaxID=147558 RepID=A0A6A5TTW8_9PLEO|nr:hypothetical protein CC80DRAFT_492391 [Byssothecium circinans]